MPTREWRQSSASEPALADRRGSLVQCVSFPALLANGSTGASRATASGSGAPISALYPTRGCRRGFSSEQPRDGAAVVPPHGRSVIACCRASTTHKSRRLPRAFLRRRMLDEGVSGTIEEGVEAREGQLQLYAHIPVNAELGLKLRSNTAEDLAKATYESTSQVQPQRNLRPVVKLRPGTRRRRDGALPSTWVLRRKAGAFTVSPLRHCPGAPPVPRLPPGNGGALWATG